MKIRTTLTLCFLTLATLLPAAPVKDAASIYRSLVTPPAKAQANALHRAESYPSLAFLPAEVDALLALNIQPAKAAAVMSTPIVKAAAAGAAPAAGPFEKPEIAERVRSFALGVDAANTQSLATYLPIYSYMVSRKEGMELSQSWANSAVEDYAGTIRKIRFSQSRGASLAAVSKLKTTTLKPIYAVVTVNYESRNYLPGMMSECIAAAKGPGAEAVNENGYKGWKYSAAALLPDVHYADTIGNQLKNAFSAKSVYQLYKIEDNALVMVICENPADCKIATTSKESVLNTGKLSFADYTINREGVGLLYATPELTNLFTAYSNTNVNVMSGFFSQAFKALSAENKEKATIFNSAARGAVALGDWLNSFGPQKCAKPFTVVAWRMPSGAIHIRIRQDACGASYAAGKLALTRFGASSKTVFYTESTPYTPAKKASIPDLIVHAANFYAAFDTTTAEGETTETGSQLVRRLYSPMAALKSVGKALGKSSAWTVFNVKGAPHISYYSTYSDTKALTRAGERMASTVAVLLGVKTKGLYKARKGKRATSININLPQEFAVGKPNVLVTSNSIAIGSLPALNNLVLKHARGNMSFTGSVYSIRPAALASIVGAAAAANPAAGMMVGMAGVVLGSIGDVHAVDTIQNGVRDIHILIRKAGDSSIEPVALPGAVPGDTQSGDEDVPAAIEGGESAESGDAEDGNEEELDADSEDDDWESSDWD